MSRRFSISFLVLVLMVVACQLVPNDFPTRPPATPPASTAVPPTAVPPTQPPATEPGPTSTPIAVGLTPTSAPSSLRIAVRAPDNSSVQIVDTGVSADLANNPSNYTMLPPAGVAGNTVFALGFSGPTAQAVAIDPANPAYPPAVHDLDFVQNINYGLAVWPGGQGSGPRLAWGTQFSNDTNQSQLFASAPDGSQVDTLLTEDVPSANPYELVAERWSTDGQSLYYSKEPYGIGGYILFAGASSLYRIGLADQQVVEVLPFNPETGHLICLDSFSPDQTLVADHCAEGVITVRNLTDSQTSTIQPPAEVTDFGPMGSARFSPDGSRLAFALARGDPDAEQGWVAVSDGLDGGSRLIATGSAGQSFTVVAWLNSSTLLVQTNSTQCSDTCVNELWTLNVDDGTLTKVTDGIFLTMVDGYQP